MRCVKLASLGEVLYQAGVVILADMSGFDRVQAPVSTSLNSIIIAVSGGV
jgi:hypothetical protein